MANIGDFNPDTDSVELDKLHDIDKWALSRLNQLIKSAHEAYSNYEFHIIFHAINNFCTIDMSKLYIDITKDRVYVEKPDSEARRAAQTAMYLIISALTRIIAPILSFTAEEIWSFLPHASTDDTRSVFLNDMPVFNEDYCFDGIEECYNKLFEMRDEVMKALEEARASKLIGKSLDAKVKVTVADDEKFELLQSFADGLDTIFIVSHTDVCRGDADSVEVAPADGIKCVRCWKYASDCVEIEGSHICGRCAEIVKEL